MSELVSIITPAFNAQSHLQDAVASALAQSYDNWEMLIVSDDGVDYQQHLSERGIRDERCRFFSSPAYGSGPNVARNVALKAARGRWIAPLDADDVYFPDRILLLLDAAVKTGLSLDNVLVRQLSNEVHSGAESNNTDLVYSVDHGAATADFDFKKFKQSLVPLLFLFSREHIDRGWDEDIARGADTLFNLRGLERAGGKAMFVCKPQHEYRVHEQSMCHAQGSEALFVEAYRYTLERLRTDGLGFQETDFRRDVSAMLEEKQQINAEYKQAVQDGYAGNYQNFATEFYAHR